MKLRFAWRYWLFVPVIGSDIEQEWWGTCPVWANQNMPEGAVLRRQRVAVNGKRVPCNVPTCNGSHHLVARPW